MDTGSDNQEQRDQIVIELTAEELAEGRQRLLKKLRELWEPFKFVQDALDLPDRDVAVLLKMQDEGLVESVLTLTGWFFYLTEAGMAAAKEAGE